MNPLPPKFVTSVLASAAILAAGCSSSDSNDPPPPVPDPVDVTAGVGSLGLTTLASLLESTGLDTVLQGVGPFTLLAPSNAAFDALDSAQLAFLMDPANASVLEETLRYHLLDADVSSTAAASQPTIAANNGDLLTIESLDGDLFFNDTRVVNGDVTVGNGRIHVVDSVLLLATDINTAITERGLSHMAAALSASSVNLTGLGFTVFTPTNAAFEAFAVANGNTDFADFLANVVPADLDSLLTRHAIVGGNTLGAAIDAGDLGALAPVRLFFDSGPGSAPTVNGVDISAFNVPTMQSIIHEVDAVMGLRDPVLDVAAAAGLTQFVANVAQVDGLNGLDATITAAGTLTILAPSNAAWADAGLVNLQDGSNDALLEQVLRYHLVTDAIQAKELATLSTLDSIDSDPIGISVAGNGTITLTGDAAGANETTSTVGATNAFAVRAVVHVVDTVMIPPGVTLP